MRSTLLAALAAAPMLLTAAGATAECCRVVKTDTELPPATVRVCEASASGQCEVVLFAGTLELGQSEEVCAGGSTILYEELDPYGQVFMDPVEARCEGGDVEL